jgi:serine/threonine-protein kinase HipA
VTLAEVRLWGRTIGAVSLADGSDVAAFQYDPEFARSAIEVAPLAMPLATRVYSFPELPRASFHGLPGLLADSLPDRFGHALIDAWLATQGRAPEDFNSVERLCYVGARGMGALEFVPALGPRSRQSTQLKVEALVELASQVLTRQAGLEGSLARERAHAALGDILKVGTSAGGARAKAVIAWNETTGEVRSGQVRAPPGFGYWLLKFDGVRGNRDKELEDPQGYGLIEFAYARMAAAAGLELSESRLLEEGGRRHFMTRRFDRGPAGEKRHMQSLAALAHLDFNAAGAHSYEQAFAVMRRLGLGMAAIEQQFRRMLFNVVARNQDDHVKNIAFLMDRGGHWSLAPAFDVTFSYNPAGRWTARHQMTINGKQDEFGLADFHAAAATAGLRRGGVEQLLGEVCAAVAEWPRFATEAGVSAEWREHVREQLRLGLADHARTRARSAGTGPRPPG